MVHANNQQFFGVALIVDAERLDRPTPHDGARSQPRDRAVEFSARESLDTSLDFHVEIRSSSRIAFEEVVYRVDDVCDRLFGVDDVQRPRAASMISLARFASTTRPWRYDSSAKSRPAS